ncbi:MAG: hypothetical protein GX591_06345 [Planctomycetes bacterium]|nr:hypothetical protein [Planctomycetota bacterium]
MDETMNESLPENTRARNLRDWLLVPSAAAFALVHAAVLCLVGLVPRTAGDVVLVALTTEGVLLGYLRCYQWFSRRMGLPEKAEIEDGERELRSKEDGG